MAINRLAATDDGLGSEIDSQTWAQSEKAVARMLAAVMAAKSAKSTREFAHARVKVHEPAISKMLKSGVSQASILECLTNAMPSIPKKDIQAALECIRQRLIRERKKTYTVPAHAQTKPKPLADKVMPNHLLVKTPEIPQEIKPLSLQPRTDNSDRAEGESEDDYLLRKSLEPKPDRRKLIDANDY